MLWILLGLLAYADPPCDGKALATSLSEASPSAASVAFAKLAACDTERAHQAAPDALGRMLADERSTQALLAAIQVDAAPAALDWLKDQEPDLRSRAISKLGATCPEHPEVGAFFVTARQELGSDFWVQRWHRGLAECRDPGVRDLLTEALANNEVGRPSRNTQQFYALLEVYARNLGVDALPQLTDFLQSSRTEAEAVILTSIFADAAKVGGREEVKPEVADAVVKALVISAPNLPQRAVDRARGTLVAIGREAAASSLARYYWPDRFMSDSYTYGVIAVEDITCKNGSKRAVLHYATLTEGGKQWADQLVPLVEIFVNENWNVRNASRCKGTSTLTIKMTPEPFKDATAIDVWRKGVLEEFGERFGGVKTWIVAEDGFGF